MKADSLSTNTGFLVPCQLMTTAFIAGMHSSNTIQNGSNKMPLNLYTKFVGPPATGKSQALKDCVLKPMSVLRDDQDLGEVIIQKCLSQDW